MPPYAQILMDVLWIFVVQVLPSFFISLFLILTTSRISYLKLFPYFLNYFHERNIGSSPKNYTVATFCNPVVHIPCCGAIPHGHIPHLFSNFGASLIIQTEIYLIKRRALYPVELGEDTRFQPLLPLYLIIFQAIYLTLLLLCYS